MTNNILDDSYESDLTEDEHEQLILMSEHAVAPPLSPAASAGFQAFNSRFDWIEDGVPGPQFDAIAGTLRAAADSMSPDWTPVHCITYLRAIAAELEGNLPESPDSSARS